MSRGFSSKMLILSLTVFLPVLVSSSIVFPLYKTPQDHPANVIERDQARHALLFNSTAYFPLEGSFHLNFYYTKVKLGTPSSEMNAVFDSGSDDLWVSCFPCFGCPLSSPIGVEPNLFNPASSTTISPLECKDKLCPHCSKSNECTYSTTYHDGSAVSGYYYRDTLSFDTLLAGSMTANSSASIAFGCTTRRSGTLSHIGIDGILGFGRGPLSTLSQLSSAHMTPKVFSHCLNGEGGGSLALGRAVAPNIVYTRLVPDKTHYYVNMQKISVNGKRLRIRPSVFKKSHNNKRGTIFDSGTSYAYLVKEAYGPLVTALNNAVAISDLVTLTNTSVLENCYLVDNSTTIYEVFPDISLDFAGGVSMKLGPELYLIDFGFYAGAARWCLGFRSSRTETMTILGDLALRNRIVVYDLEQNSIGFNDYYNCSLPIQVTLESSSSSISKSGTPGMLSMVLLGTTTLLVMQL